VAFLEEVEEDEEGVTLDLGLGMVLIPLKLEELEKKGQLVEVDSFVLRKFQL
jgi:hypothetical protein